MARLVSKNEKFVLILRFRSQKKEKILEKIGIPETRNKTGQKQLIKSYF